MSTRQENRDRFPFHAQWADKTGGKLLYARDDAGELGKLPLDPPSWCWIENVPPPYVQPKGKWN